MARQILILVDVQNDFVKGGVLGYGYPEKSNTEALIAYAKEWQKNPSHLLIATADTHPENYLEATLEGKKLPVPHCIENTKGWRLVFEDTKSGYEQLDCNEVFEKPTFGSENLVNWIAEEEGAATLEDEFDEIQIAGYCSSICVAANAILLRAKFPNKKIVFLEKLSGDIDETSHKAAIKVMQNQQIEVV